MLLMGCKDQLLQEECSKFRSAAGAASERAAAVVPSEQRERESAGPQRAAWHRKLADAFEQESTKPPQFKNERVQGYEAQLKKTFAQTAVALRKTADGFDKGDKTLVQQGQVEDVESNGARSKLLLEVDKSCTK